jgi:Uma2 family endonuclease
MAQPARRPLDYDDYLAFERASEEKHHFLDGELFAMSGGTIHHSTLQTRMIGMLYVALRGSPCAPHASDLRVAIPDTGDACYPDVTIVCGPVAPAPYDPEAATNPTVLVEVLSPSSEAYDRGRKFEKYRTLASLREYVLVAQDRPHVEVFRRGADGLWTLHEHRAGDTIELTSVGIRIAMDELYEGIPEAPPAPPVPAQPSRP